MDMASYPLPNNGTATVATICASGVRSDGLEQEVGTCLPSPTQGRDGRIKEMTNEIDNVNRRYIGEIR